MNKKALVVSLSEIIPLMITTFLFAICIGLLVSFMQTLTFAVVWADVESHTTTLLVRLISSADCFAYEERYSGRDITDSYDPRSYQRVRAGLIDFSKLTKWRVRNCMQYGVEETSGADMADIGGRLGYYLVITDLKTGEVIFFESFKNCYGGKLCQNFGLKAPVLMVKNGKIVPVEVYLRLDYNLYGVEEPGEIQIGDLSI